MPKLKRLKILAAGYAVVVVFTLAFVIIDWIGIKLSNDFSILPLSSNLAILIAAIIAAPVALAFVWERISRIRIYEVEISLNDVTVESTVRLAEEMQEIQRQQMGPSIMPEILARIKKAMEAVVGNRVLEVNLGRGESWWATRLYLLAALAADYTSIQDMVFLAESSETGKLSVVGLGHPDEVRRILGQTYPFLEAAYHHSRDNIEFGGTHGAAEVEIVVQNFGIKLYELKPDELKDNEPALSKVGAKEWVTPEFVKRFFLANSALVDWDGGPETNLLRYRILDRPRPLVYLVDGGSLRKVVDRDELARRIAKRSIKQFLEGA